MEFPNLSSTSRITTWERVAVVMDEDMVALIPIIGTKNYEGLDCNYKN